jgi:hypothetical protein
VGLESGLGAHRRRVLLAAGLVDSAAAHIGKNGKIAFTANGAIYTINPDGSGLTEFEEKLRERWAEVSYPRPSRRGWGSPR